MCKKSNAIFAPNLLYPTSSFRNREAAKQMRRPAKVRVVTIIDSVLIKIIDG